MDRLTISFDGNYVPEALCGIDRLGGVDDCDSCSECCEQGGSDCSGCAIQECFNRLAAYENTGLTPEKILELDRMYQELSKEVMQYRNIGTVEECREAVERQKAKKGYHQQLCG